MDESLGYILVRAIFGIFKGRPNFAFSISVFIAAGFLSIWIITAKNPDDRAYPVIGLIFLFIAVLGRYVHFVSERILHGIQAQEEDQADEVAPAAPARSLVEPPALAQEITPLPKIPAVPTQVQSKKAERREKKEFYYYGLTGRDALQTLLISVLFVLLGYFAVSLFGTAKLLSLATQYEYGWATAATNLRADDFGTTIFHLFCGLPTALCTFSPIFAILLLSLGFLIKNRPKFVKVFMVFPSFLFGILIFIPILILFLIATDFLLTLSGI
jgi:hypothetical protein